MNGPADQIAKTRANLAKLNAVFRFLEDVEPRMIARAKELLGNDLDEAGVCLRAYALETGQTRVSMSFTLTFDFDKKKPSVAMRSEIIPPARVRERASPL